MKKVILLGSAKSTEAYVTELSRIKNVEVIGFLDPDSKQNKSLFDDFFSSWICSKKQIFSLFVGK